MALMTCAVLYVSRLRFKLGGGQIDGNLLGGSSHLVSGL